MKQELYTSSKPTIAVSEMDIEVTNDDEVIITPRRHESFIIERANPHTKRQLCGATIAGGLAGLFCGGPVVGAMTACGAALAISSRSNTGAFARDGGEAVAKIGDKIREMDQKHHIVDKTKESASKIGDKIKELDQKHHIVDQTKENASKIGDKIREIDEKHHFVDKTKDNAAKIGYRVREIDQKHHIVDKTKENAAKLGGAMREIDEKHHVVDKTKEHAIQGFEWAKKRIEPKDMHTRQPRTR